MKSLFATTAILLAFSTSAFAANNYCIAASRNLANIHADLANAYSDLAQIMQTGMGKERIPSLQMRVVNGNNALPSANQQFAQLCAH